MMMGEIPGPSNAGIPASENKLSGATEKITDSINVDRNIRKSHWLSNNPYGRTY